MAVEFDGTAGLRVLCGSDASIDDIFDGAGGTITAWIRTDAVTAAVRQITGKTDVNDNGWSFFSFDGEIRLFYGFTTTAGYWRCASGAISVDTWHHVAMTYDADATTVDPTFYVDGAVSTTTEITTPVGTRHSDAATTAHIGDRSATSQPMDGEIEDVRWWSGEILTLEPIAFLAAGFRGPIGGEAMWISCEDFEGLAHPDGTTLTVDSHYLADKSVNDNRGNPTDSPVARASDAPRWPSWIPKQMWDIFEQTAAGSITNTGSLVKRPGKIVAGVITNTGALVLSARKIVAGAITNTGSLVREVQTAVAGAITNTGALVKQTSVTVAGAITNTGALTTVKAVLSKLYVWTAKFRATDSEDPMHAGSDEKRGRA